MAKMLGISPQDLCDIEKGRKSVSIERAVNFARKLNDSPEVFALAVIQDELYQVGLDCRVRLESEEGGGITYFCNMEPGGSFLCGE